MFTATADALATARATSAVGTNVPVLSDASRCRGRGEDTWKVQGWDHAAGWPLTHVCGFATPCLWVQIQARKNRQADIEDKIKAQAAAARGISDSADLDEVRSCRRCNATAPTFYSFRSAPFHQQLQAPGHAQF